MPPVAERHLTVAVGFNPRMAMTREKVRRGATIESGAMTTIELLVDDAIQSSLRDEIAWRDCRPWVETHDYLRRSLRDQRQERKSFRRERRFVGWPSFGEAGCQRHKKLRVDIRTGTTSLSDSMYALNFLYCAPRLKQAEPPSARRGATFDGSRGFQPTDGDDTGMIRRAATMECGGQRRE